jgi:hypothetical protein
MGRSSVTIIFAAFDPSETLTAKFALMHKAAFVFTSGGDAATPFASPNEKTDWEKNHAPDRFCFTHYRNDGFAGHRR